MANDKKLASNWLSRLNNAYHDSMSEQILQLTAAAGIENAALEAAVAALTTARQAEDAAYQRLSKKDFTSEDLQQADSLQDAYMSTVHNVLLGYSYLPDADVSVRRKAQELEQTFRDFGFQVKDGMEAEARKVVNMMQHWAQRQQDMESLGLWIYAQKALVAAQQVLEYSAQRAHNDAQRVKGELADARRQTDQAVASVYELLNALQVLMPSETITALVTDLNGLQARAEQYYIGGKAQEEKPESATDDSNQQQSENPGADGESTTVSPIA